MPYYTECGRVRKNHLARRLHKNKKQKHKAAPEIARGFGYVHVLLAVCFLSIIALYLGAVNASAVRGSQVFDIDQKIAELERQHAELKIREAQLRLELQKSDVIAAHGMKPIEIAEFVNVDDDRTVAIGQ